MSDYILSDEPCPKCGGRTIQNHTGHECGSNSCDWNASHADARLAALETENARLREVVDAARAMRDQYLPTEGIGLQTFEDLWVQIDRALAALDGGKG